MIYIPLQPCAPPPFNFQGLADVYTYDDNTEHLNHDNIDVHREASRAIANLLTSFGNHNAIIRDGIPGLVHLALSADLECQYHAALAFRKLAPNLNCNMRIVR